jgi:ABC-type spermidine/putrescine transport system permease subunit I
MNNSLKAALLSGLVFPGLGQIFLKHYKRAAVIILAVFGSLALVIVKATQLALTILEKIESEGRLIDIDSITEATSQATASILTINFGFLLIIICWIIGTVDAYRVGKKKDKEENSILNYKI